MLGDFLKKAQSLGQTSSLSSFADVLKQFEETLKCEQAAIDRIIEDTKCIHQRTFEPDLQDSLFA
jgi:hypothetical protein